MWVWVGEVVSDRRLATSSALMPSAVTQDTVGGGVAAAEQVRVTPRVLGNEMLGGGSSSRRGPSLKPQQPRKEEDDESKCGNVYEFTNVLWQEKW